MNSSGERLTGSYFTFNTAMQLLVEPLAGMIWNICCFMYYVYTCFVSVSFLVCACVVLLIHVCDCVCMCLLFVYNIFEKQAMNVIFDDVSCSDIRTFIDVIKWPD